MKDESNIKFKNKFRVVEENKYTSNYSCLSVFEKKNTHYKIVLASTY